MICRLDGVRATVLMLVRLPRACMNCAKRNICGELLYGGKCVDLTAKLLKQPTCL